MSADVVRPPFPYYGGKGLLAKRIVELLPPHMVYGEPYCGSAAVLLAKPEARHETINDLDGEVVNLFRVLRDRPQSLCDALALTPYSRDEFALARTPVGADVGALERARRFMVRSCQSYNAAGNGGSGWAPPSASRNQSRSRTFTGIVDGRLEAVANRLRHVAIDNTDALAVIDRLDRPDAAIYVDPPYLAGTRASVGSGTYRLDAAGQDHHEALLERLEAFSGACVLSGYPSELYADRLRGWHRVDVSRRRPTQNGATSSSDATEVLWVNRSQAAEGVGGE